MEIIILAFLLIAIVCLAITFVITAIEHNVARRKEQAQNLAAFREENAARYSRLGVRPPRNGSVNGPARTIDEQINNAMLNMNQGSPYRFGISVTPAFFRDYLSRLFHGSKVPDSFEEYFDVHGIGIFTMGALHRRDAERISFSVPGERKIHYEAGVMVDCTALTRKQGDDALLRSICFFEHSDRHILEGEMFRGSHFIDPHTIDCGYRIGWHIRKDAFMLALSPLDDGFSYNASWSAAMNVTQLLSAAAEEFSAVLLAAGFRPS